MPILFLYDCTKESDFSYLYHVRYVWDVSKKISHVFVHNPLFSDPSYGYTEDGEDTAVLKDAKFFSH